MRTAIRTGATAPAGIPMTAAKWIRLVGAVCALTVVLSLFVGSGTTRAEARTFVVEMKNFQFAPSVLQINPGDLVTIRVFNNDTTGHTFDITEYDVRIGTRESPLQPGQNGTDTFTADVGGTFWFFCDIPGHASRSGSGYTGMAGRLVVGQPSDSLGTTLPLIVGGVAAGIVLVGLVLWLRRKSGHA